MGYAIYLDLLKKFLSFFPLKNLVNSGIWPTFAVANKGLTLFWQRENEFSQSKNKKNIEKIWSVPKNDVPLQHFRLTMKICERFF